MEALKLTNKQNEEVFVILNRVATFSQDGRGTKVTYDNGQTIEVTEPLSIVEYLLDHYILEVDFDDETD